ncbi:MAG: glycogen/starch/alpha-glucan phosphorylase, partial [Kiritimatiellia bacterium]
ADEELKTVIEWIASDYFTPGEHGVLQPIRRSLLDHGDPFMVLADYRAYCDAQGRVDKAYRDRKAWARSAILNVARVGKFSSDRTISDYNREVWKIKPLHPKA